MTKVLAVIVACLSLNSCANVEKKTRIALELNEQDFIQQECQLNALFLKESEFSKLNDTKFCSGDLEITNLEKIAETESIADYKITFKAKHRKLKKWLQAYEKLQTRKIPSTQQQQVKALIQKLSDEKRDWIYQKHTVKLSLTENGWRVDDVIR